MTLKPNPPLPQSTEIKKIHVKSSFICKLYIWHWYLGDRSRLGIEFLIKLVLSIYLVRPTEFIFFLIKKS